MSRSTTVLTRCAAAAASLASLLAGPAQGAGFALQENSASGLGNAYAGGAASADDASTLWNNAAGMARLGGGQVAAALNLVQPSMKFANGASVAAAQQPLGGDGGDAGSMNYVPNLYLTYPIDARWTVGVGLNAPFGLVTEYDSNWIGRFQAIKSEIKTYNVNPAVSWKATDAIAIGLGANYQHLEGTFTSQVNYSAALLSAAVDPGGIAPGSPTFNAIAAATPGLVSGASVEGSDSAWGWNLGVLIEIDPSNRIGAHYRSGFSYTLSGDVSFTNPALPAVPPPLAPVVGALASGVNSKLSNSGVTSKIKLPEIVNVSYFGNLNPQWDLMADVQYTGWGSIQNLTFTRSDGSPLQTTALNFKDAWRFAVGANYRYNGEWLFRGGLAYDQSPVQDANRTSRLPDADRTWLALGFKYTANPKLWFDVGAAYIWVAGASINDMGSTNLGIPPSVAQNGLINGSYNNNVVVLSGQLTWAF